jgi:hypothetical protein
MSPHFYGARVSKYRDQDEAGSKQSCVLLDSLFDPEDGGDTFLLKLVNFHRPHGVIYQEIEPCYIIFTMKSVKVDIFKTDLLLKMVWMEQVAVFPTASQLRCRK